MYANLGAVEHLQAENVEMFRGAGTDDFGKAAYSDAHQFAALALCGLFLTQISIAYSLHRFLKRRVVVAAVVVPAKSRPVRELLRFDEVLHSEIGRVHADFMGHYIRYSLDCVDRFGDSERAAICDSSRRLIRVHAIDFNVGRFQIIRTGADVEETGGKLRWISRSVGVTVVGDRLDSESGERTVLLGCKLGAHMIVPRE